MSDNRIIITEQEIIGKYLGIPYKNMGRDLTGLDCWGIIKLIYADMGFDLWDPVKSYESHWYNSNNHFIENYHKEWQQVDKPCFLDGILFHDGFNRINHCALYLSGNRFIQGCKCGVVVSKLDTQYWQSRLNGFYRFRQLMAGKQ